MHCIPMQHISLRENFLLFSMNKSCKEGPSFSSINTIEFLVFPVVIIFGMPKSLKRYKLRASSSK